MRANFVQNAHKHTAALLAVTMAFVVRAFDGAYATLRAGASVAPDDLIYYNMVQTWWRHGDSPTGHTLLPSPYFIDLVLQIPIAILAPDFERFAYFLALAFCLLIACSLFAASRVVVGGRVGLAGVVAALTVIGYYGLAPPRLIAQICIQNHTTEIFATLGTIAALHWLHQAKGRRKRYAAALYTLVIAVCVTSSPFFIATYCIPAAVGAAALLGTPAVTWRRLLGFLALTSAGALIGLVTIAAIDRYWWPVRGDAYGLTLAQSWLAFRETISLPEVVPLAVATALAGIACTVIAAALRARRSVHHGAIFYAAFVAAAIVSCSAIPVLRRAFSNPYEIRYLQLPFILGVQCHAGALVAAILYLANRARQKRTLSLPRWSARGAVLALMVAAIVAAATVRGPLTIFSAGSKTSAAIACFAAAEKEHGLEDGLAAIWSARYFNAARHSAGWRSKHVLIQMDHWRHPPPVSAIYNNLFWFNDGLRHGRGRVNFLATHLFSEASLRFVRERIGTPDEIVSCPVPVDSREPGSGETFEIWVWKSAPAVERLTEMVVRDNARSPFSPAIGEKRQEIDVAWGMHTGCDDTEAMLIGKRRVWHRGIRCEGPFLFTPPFTIPSGRYRIDLEFAATPAAADSSAGFVTLHVGSTQLSRIPLPAGMHHVAWEADVHNRGGPTSGDAVTLTVLPADTDVLEVSGMTLTQLRPEAIDPFRVFRE
jgi:hypothetical protein